MGFKTNTGKLWNGGAQTLPTVADEFAYFSNRMDTFRDHGPHFNSEVAKGTIAALGKEWDTLATDLQRAMAKTATNLRHTGRALVMFAEQTAGTDTDAAGEIDKAAKELKKHKTLPIVPVYPNKEPKP